MLLKMHLDGIRTPGRECLRSDGSAPMVTLAEEVCPRERGSVACAKSVVWQKSTANKRQCTLLALAELPFQDGGVQALADQVETYWWPADHNRFAQEMRRAVTDDIREMLTSGGRIPEKGERPALALQSPTLPSFVTPSMKRIESSFSWRLLAWICG